MVSTDCLQIIKFDERYYVSPLIQNWFVGLIRVEHFIQAGPKAIQRINWPKKRDENSDNLIRHFQAHFWLIGIPTYQLG